MDVARGGGKVGMAGGGWLLDWGSGFRLRSPALKSRPVARDRRCMTGTLCSVARHFFVSSSGRPGGREREGISSQSTPRNPRAMTRGFRRNPGLVTCSSTILTGSSTKAGLPHPLHLQERYGANAARAVSVPSLSHLSFPTMNLALNPHPSGPDPRAGVAGHPHKPVSSSLPTRRRVNAA
jgi:hypothetical protein